MASSPHREGVDFRTESPRFHETSTQIHGGSQRVETFELPPSHVRHVRILGEAGIVVNSFPSLSVLETCDGAPVKLTLGSRRRVRWRRRRISWLHRAAMSRVEDVRRDGRRHATEVLVRVATLHPERCVLR